MFRSRIALITATALTSLVLRRNGEIDLTATAAVAGTAFSPSGVHQNPPHRLGGGGEKMTSSVELLIPAQP